MAIPLTPQDLLALEAIADLDDNDCISSDEGHEPIRRQPSFGSEDDSIFDLVEDDGDRTLGNSFVHLAPIAAVTGEHRTVSGAIVQRNVPTGVDAAAPVSLTANSLKRAASADAFSQETSNDKPAKLNKSFSEGLDELFERVSLETVPDDEAPKPLSVPTRQSRDPAFDSDIETQLAIEDEIRVESIKSRQGSLPHMALPNFKIPEDVLRRAIAGNEKEVNTYWSHTLYRGPYSQPVTLLYARTKEQSEKIAQSMMNEPVLGYDMEWATFGPLTGIKRNVSLIQLACEDKTALFHIALHEGTTVDELFAPTLRKILESPAILKPGVCSWKADGSRLLRECNIRCQGLIELSQMHQVAFKGDVESIDDKYMSLAKQTQQVLRLPLLKDDVRKSRWELELSQKQILYAANDAYAGFMLYRHLDHRRLTKWPLRKRPDFAELRISMRKQYNPISTGDGQRRRSVPKDKSQDMSRDTMVQPTPMSPTKERPIFEDEREARLFRALASHRASSMLVSSDATPRALPSNAILKAITMARPTDIDALRKVSGVGPTRISAHGETWLRIVSEHMALWSTPVPETRKSDGFRVPPILPILPPLPASHERARWKNHLKDTTVSEDNDAFETMPETRRRVSTPRWTV